MMIILPEQVTQAIGVLENAGYDAYVVGDCVRELLLGNNPQDYDIVTNAGINDILFAFREYRISDERMKRGEVLVTVVGMIIQVSPYRREVVGNRVMYAEDLETDLFRRGFTMNAMAYSPRTGLSTRSAAGRPYARTLRQSPRRNARRFRRDWFLIPWTNSIVAPAW